MNTAADRVLTKLLRICIVGLMLVAVTPLSALAAGDRAAEAQDLIERLGAPQWSERQRALDELVELGESARPALERVVATTDDAEIRTRAEVALGRIAESLAIDATMVTLRMVDASPRDVFDELARLAGATIRPDPLELWESRQWPRISIDVQRAPFWEVFHEACIKAGLAPRYANVPSGELILVSDLGRAFADAPVSIDGPFMAIVSSITRSENAGADAQNVPRHSGMVRMQVWMEPKLRLLQTSPTAQLTDVADEHGRAIAQSVRVVHGTVSTAPWTMTLHLVLDEETGIRIVRLRGRADVEVHTDSGRVEIADILNSRAVLAGAGEHQLLLDEVRPAGETYVLRLSLLRGFDSPRMMGNQAHAAPQLLDAQGRPLWRRSLGRTREDGLPGLQVIYATTANGHAPVGPPDRLIWELPFNARRIEMRFDFRDLPFR